MLADLYKLPTPISDEDRVEIKFVVHLITEQIVRKMYD